MQSIPLSGHYDGKQIVLDKPYTLEPNTRVIIAVLPKQKKLNEERDEWFTLSRNSLANVYDEPDYTLNMIKRVNPDYAQGR
jgi:hypothetical protein